MSMWVVWLNAMPKPKLIAAQGTLNKMQNEGQTDSRDRETE